MNFKKLALVAAVAAAPMSAMALEPMQDEALSGVTGQDGISIGLATDVSADLIVHDKDGIDGNVGNAGAMVINGFSITRASNADTIDLVIDADDGDDGSSVSPYLNIGVTLPDNLTVNLGSLDVAKSNRPSSWGATTANAATNVVTLGSMTLGTTDLNIQLGNEPQGNMIALDTTITGGVNISGFAVKDAGDQGGTGISGGKLLTDLQIVDTGSGDLTVNTGIDLDATDGVVIGLDGIGGTGTTGIDIRMADLSVDGGTNTIGDVELTGLNLTGNLTINGH